MDKVIKIKGKFLIHQLIKLESVDENVDTLVYKLKLNSQDNTIKLGHDENDNFWIEPTGGPRLVTGESIDNFKIKKIEFSYDLNNYLIILTT